MAATRRVVIGFDAPRAYAALIEPRFAPIADALVDAARPRQTDRVLELGAGTGLVTKRVAGRVHSILATDLARNTLEVARETLKREREVSFARVDYNLPLPFLDESFDLVLGGLTYVQDKSASLREIRRVLRRKGRLALAMWGPSYHEFRMLSDAREAIGWPRLPAASPGRATRRVAHAGLRAVQRHDFNLTTTFASVDEYIAYRRGFGIPAGATRRLYERYLHSIRSRASKDIGDDGHLAIGWTFTVITARRN
jgi:SAM-dependent methyltransferase